MRSKWTIGVNEDWSNDNGKHQLVEIVRCCWKKNRNTNASASRPTYRREGFISSSILPGHVLPFVVRKMPIHLAILSSMSLATGWAGILSRLARQPGPQETMNDTGMLECTEAHFQLAGREAWWSIAVASWA